MHPRPTLLAMWRGMLPDSFPSPIEGEGRGEGADSRARADTHLTLPALRAGPLPLPPAGRRGATGA
jgi:hypothetical protein